MSGLGVESVNAPEETMKTVYHFMDKYVGKIYGKRYVASWLKKHRGKSYLDMFTMSDVAFCVTVMKNNCRVWSQEHDISRMEHQEQKKWKNYKNLDIEERDAYTREKPSFTANRGSRRTYMTSGWNGAGMKYYQEVLGRWRGLSRDQGCWEKIEVGWESYIEETGFGEQWKKRDVASRVLERLDDEDDDDDDGGVLPLPGLPGYQDDRGWRSRGNVSRGGELDDELMGDGGEHLGDEQQQETSFEEDDGNSSNDDNDERSSNSNDHESEDNDDSSEGMWGFDGVGGKRQRTE
mmetsp:Transcript_2927/g.6334  ORF Transcript_2927/g.6334 Transcript_2927/m.6334 type:complete len:292 (+) Transcript_2927:843-1718(+)